MQLNSAFRIPTSEFNNLCHLPAAAKPGLLSSDICHLSSDLCYLFLRYHQLAHIARLNGDDLDNLFLFGGFDYYIHRRQFGGFAVSATDGGGQQDGVIRGVLRHQPDRAGIIFDIDDGVCCRVVIFEDLFIVLLGSTDNQLAFRVQAEMAAVFQKMELFFGTGVLVVKDITQPLGIILVGEQTAAGRGG